MQFTIVKVLVITTWLLAVVAVGALLHLPVGAWIPLLGFGALPIIVLLRGWRHPARSISETIQSALRP